MAWIFLGIAVIVDDSMGVEPEMGSYEGRLARELPPDNSQLCEHGSTRFGTARASHRNRLRHLDRPWRGRRHLIGSAHVRREAESSAALLSRGDHCRDRWDQIFRASELGSESAATAPRAHAPSVLPTYVLGAPSFWLTMCSRRLGEHQVGGSRTPPLMHDLVITEADLEWLSKMVRDEKAVRREMRRLLLSPPRRPRSILEHVDPNRQIIEEAQAAGHLPANLHPPTILDCSSGRASV